MFDSANSGWIERQKVHTILDTMGQAFDDRELDRFLTEQDTEGEGKG